MTPALKTSRGFSVFWGLMYLLMASIRMLNIRATAKTELPNAPTTSARRKPNVLFRCCLIWVARKPKSPMIVDSKWERTAKASEARERELPTCEITSSSTKRRTQTTHMRIIRKLRPEYLPMAAAAPLSQSRDYNSWITLPFSCSEPVIFGITFYRLL
ncbi:hypothetical protein LEMLEM_LOCUS24595 [Lemmus lemmus]